jgi:DNA-directed RNA polymerase specialized sigma24 family protein
MSKPSQEQIAFVREVRLRHHAELVIYVVGLVRAARLPGDPRQVAEDIVQNVYSNLLQYKLPAQIEIPIAYLKVVGLREFIKYRDRQMKEQFWHAEPGDRVVESIADERFAEPPDAIAQGVLGQAIALLPEQEGRVIRMFADGMKPQEVADALSIPRSEVAKALRMLRKSINDVIHGRVRK